jgi:hypothetical protein
MNCSPPQLRAPVSPFSSDYEIIESEHSIATAVSKKSTSILSFLAQCLPKTLDMVRTQRAKDSHDSLQEIDNDSNFGDFSSRPSHMGGQQSKPRITAVRLHLSVFEAKGCRRVAIRGLYGSHSEMLAFMSQFRRKLESELRTVPGGIELLNQSLNFEQESPFPEESNDFELSSFRGGHFDVSTQRSHMSGVGQLQSKKRKHSFYGARGSQLISQRKLQIESMVSQSEDEN